MANATAKTTNYTPEQTTELVKAYSAADTQESREEVIEKFAQKFGKGVRSIVAKLSREEVYIKKTVETKGKREGKNKDDLAQAIGAVLKLSEGEVDSLTKANLTALDKVFQALAMSKPIDGNQE
jgi:hypothetical protein